MGYGQDDRTYNISGYWDPTVKCFQILNTETEKGDGIGADFVSILFCLQFMMTGLLHLLLLCLFGFLLKGVTNGFSGCSVPALLSLFFHHIS